MDSGIDRSNSLRARLPAIPSVRIPFSRSITCLLFHGRPIDVNDVKTADIDARQARSPDYGPISHLASLERPFPLFHFLPRLDGEIVVPVGDGFAQRDDRRAELVPRRIYPGHEIAHATAHVPVRLATYPDRLIEPVSRGPELVEASGLRLVVTLLGGRDAMPDEQTPVRRQRLETPLRASEPVGQIVRTDTSRVSVGAVEKRDMMVGRQEQMPRIAVPGEHFRGDDGLAGALCAGHPHAHRSLSDAGDETLVEREVDGLSASDAGRHRIKVVSRAKPGVTDFQARVQVRVGKMPATQGHPDMRGSDIGLELPVTAGHGRRELDGSMKPLLRALALGDGVEFLHRCATTVHGDHF